MKAGCRSPEVVGLFLWKITVKLVLIIQPGSGFGLHITQWFQQEAFNHGKFQVYNLNEKYCWIKNMVTWWFSHK